MTAITPPEPPVETDALPHPLQWEFHRDRSGDEDLLVLGIETSCDETGVALYDSRRGLLAHALHSQVALHAEFGGVVPELASRDHVRKALPLLLRLLARTGIERHQIDAVAYTAGPGLVGALMVGASIGRSLAWGLGVPALGVHHMEGHLLAPMLEEHGKSVPPPIVPMDDYSGRVTLRLPKTLHRALAMAADEEGVSLNSYLVSLLSQFSAFCRG